MTRSTTIISRIRHIMELLERSSYLDDLAGHYRRVEKGIGHTIFLMGEAGIGKTSLVNHFPGGQRC